MKIRQLIKVERLYLYVYTCRRPSGWGRHFGYSGITNSPWHRDRQHRAKPWYPLVTRRRVIPLGRMPRGLGLALEYVLIKVTRPAYNVQHNRRNSRRITPWQAKAHRLARDAGRRPVAPRLADAGRVALAVAALAAGLWLGVR